MRTYHNTTDLKGTQLHLEIKNGGDQQKKILAFFKSNPDKHYTPCHIHMIVFGKTNVPLTSTRRAITNLTKAGKITKTETKSLGNYGKLNSTWTLSN